jgi:hypothetical protein
MISATSNAESWLLVLNEKRQYPDTEYWNRWRSLIDPLIQEAAAAGYDQLFRAGMSMHHIIFSTLDHHGLKGEPHVTVSVTDDWKIKVEYSTTNTYFSSPIHAEVVTTGSALPTLTKHLQHLWTETVPEPIPVQLRKG